MVDFPPAPSGYLIGIGREPNPLSTDRSCTDPICLMRSLDEWNKVPNLDKHVDRMLKDPGNSAIRVVKLEVFGREEYHKKLHCVQRLDDRGISSFALWWTTPRARYTFTTKGYPWCVVGGTPKLHVVYEEGICNAE